MKWSTIKKEAGQTCVSIAKFSLTQIGYHCKNDKISCSENKNAKMMLLIAALVFLLSLSSIKHKDYVGLLINMLGTIGLFFAVYQDHKDVVKEWLSSNQPVSDSFDERTPYGSQLLIFGMIVVYSVLAFIVRLFFAREPAIWLLDFAAHFVAFFNVAIASLVYLFDAEFKLK